MDFEIPPKVILEKNKIKLSGVTLKYFESGKGDQVLLFIHGFTGSIDEWYFQVQEFQQNYRILCLNLRGHGGSELGDDISFEILTEDLKNFIDVLKIKDPVIIGHSMGGMISLNYAIKYSNLKKLMIVDSLPFFRQSMPLELVERLSEKQILELFSRQLTISKQKIPKSKQAFYEKLKKWSMERREKAITGEMLKVYFKGLKKFNLTDDLKKIKVPTLILFGADDRLLSDHVKESYKKIENSKFVTFKGCGHSPPREYISEFNQVLREFLNK